MGEGGEGGGCERAPPIAVTRSDQGGDQSVNATVGSREIELCSKMPPRRF